MGLTALACRILLWRLKPGSYPRGGSVQVRLWAAERVADAMGAVTMAGAPWIVHYARLLGARISPDVDLHTVPPVTGMLRVGRGASIEPEVDLSGWWMDGDVVHVGPVHIGRDAVIGARSTIGPGVHIGKEVVVEAGSVVLRSVSAGRWVAGSPAERVRDHAPLDFPTQRPPRRPAWVAAYGASGVLLSLLPFVALVPALLVVAAALRGTTGLGQAAVRALAWTPLGAVLAVVTLALLTVVLVRLLGLGLTEGVHPVRSRVGWQAWMTERLLDQARTLLFPLYASLVTPTWLRALGATVGRDVEASTVLLLPVDDDRRRRRVPGRRHHGRVLRAGPRLGPDRAGEDRQARLPRQQRDGRTRAPRAEARPRRGPVGRAGQGQGGVELDRQPADPAAPAAAGQRRRAHLRPADRLKVFRGLVELCRLVPVVVTATIGVGVLVTLAALALSLGWVVAGLLGGLVLAAAGAVAAAVTTAAKWLVVGRIGAVEHPLWSSFVWRNEVVDTFVEMVAGPWFAWTAVGTPALTWWLRSLGATIGHGVWCETYWLPEADLVTLGDGATVNRGCVLQTHLFHDRIMSMDTVTLGAGATLGPHGVILPAASIERAATVGPGSLVLRGEEVPAGSRWTGNPIAPWRAPGA